MQIKIAQRQCVQKYIKLIKIQMIEIHKDIYFRQSDEQGTIRKQEN